ncbi:hypothetical protein BGZ47_001569, partial [Haplosporangium gracile]
MPPEPSGPSRNYQPSMRDSRSPAKPIEPPSSSSMAMKPHYRTVDLAPSNTDEILLQRHFSSGAGAVGSTQADSDATTSRTLTIDATEDPEVAAKLEQKRLEHERQRNLKRELFEKQMQQLEMQQLKEEQDMLASKNKTGPIGSNSSADLSKGSVSSQSVSRRSSDGESDLWGGMAKLSIGAEKRSGELSTIGRSGTAKEESKTTSESAFDVTPHMSQFSERFIFDDDSTSGSSARLSSLQRNIWDDQQDLGNVPSALGGSSYLPRYLQMGGDDDDDTFPTMRPASSSALDLGQISHKANGLSGAPEWPQFNSALSSNGDRVSSVSQHNSGLIGFGGIGGSKDSLSSGMPKLTTSYSTSEVPTRFSKTSSLASFDGLSDPDHHLLIKSDLGSSEVCLQFQQGNCSRGDMCPFIHSPPVSSTARSSVSMPLSPGLTMSMSGQANGAGSASFYARMSGVSGGESLNGLANSGGFPFNSVSNGNAFDLASPGGNN